MSLSSEAKKGYLFFAVILVAVAAFLLLRTTDTEEAVLLDAVPKDAVALLHVRDLSALGQSLDDAARALGVHRQTSGFKRNIVRQLGFDPFDYDDLSGRGVRAKSGVVVYSPPPGRFGVLVLDVLDPGRFEDTLMELLSARTGAERGADREVEEATIHVAESQGRPIAAWGYNGSAVVISAGVDCVSRVVSGVALEGGTIGDQLWFERGRSAVAGDASLFGWVLGDALRGFMGRRGGVVDALALGVRLTSEDVRATGWVGIDAPQRNLLDPFKGHSDAESLVDKLNADAVLLGRARVDLEGAWRLLSLGRLPPHLEELSAQLTARGMRLDRDLLPLLGGTFVLDASLIDDQDLSEVGRLDPRRLNPFRFIKTTVLASLTDGDEARELMPLVAQAVASSLRGRLVTVEIDGNEAYEIHYRLGQGMTFGVAHDLLIISGGEDAYAEALARLEGDSEGLSRRVDDESIRHGLAEQGAAGVLVDVQKLVFAAADMDSDSFGGGPTGMMVEQMVEMLVEPAGNVDFVLGTATVDDHGLLGSLQIDLEAQEEAR